MTESLMCRCRTVYRRTTTMYADITVMSGRHHGDVVNALCRR